MGIDGSIEAYVQGCQNCQNCVASWGFLLFRSCNSSAGDPNRADLPNSAPRFKHTVRPRIFIHLVRYLYGIYDAEALPLTDRNLRQGAAASLFRSCDAVFDFLLGQGSDAQDLELGFTV